MSGEVRRIGRELAYKGTLLEVYKDYMEFENGAHAQWDFIYHNGAAAVIPVLDDGRILMVSQYRSALDRNTLEIPAGKLEASDESGLICAKRELEEETGYRSDHIERLLTLRTAVAYCNEKIDIFVARNLIPSKQHLDEDEYVDVKVYTLEDLKEMIFTDKIEDSKTIAAILAYESKYLGRG